MAQNKEGKQFEDDIKDSFSKNNIYFLRLKDNPISFMQDIQKSYGSSYATNNPYDCFAYHNNHLYCLELKSSKFKSVGFEKSKDQKNTKQIKYHQIMGLLEARNHEGVNAGLLFEFREESKCYYLDIAKFMVFFYYTDKQSINIEDIINYGGIEVGREIKRVHYQYDIVKMLRDIENQRITK